MTVDHIIWRKNWLIALLSLADFELQKERWLNKDITNPAWTYVEFMNTYFDDLLWGEDYQRFIREGLVTKEEYESIKDFHTALDQYKEPGEGVYNSQTILEDKRWREITTLGKSSVKRLQALITSPEEKEIFTKKLYATPLTAEDFTWGFAARGFSDTKH